MSGAEAAHAEAGLKQGEGEGEDPPHSESAAGTEPRAQKAAEAAESAEGVSREADSFPGQVEAPAADTEAEKKGEGAAATQRQGAGDAVPGEAAPPAQVDAERQEQALEAPCCACEDPSSPGNKKRAELRTVSNARNANNGLRYWTCAQYAPRHWQRPAKKRKAQGTQAAPTPEPGCNFFRWLDQPVETREERQKAKKERLRKRELALLA